jgi:hypothetical protein
MCEISQLYFLAPMLHELLALRGFGGGRHPPSVGRSEDGPPLLRQPHPHHLLERLRVGELALHVRVLSMSGDASLTGTRFPFS